MYYKKVTKNIYWVNKSFKTNVSHACIKSSKSLLSSSYTEYKTTNISASGKQFKVIFDNFLKIIIEI